MYFISSRLLILCVLGINLCHIKCMAATSKCKKCPPGWGVLKKCYKSHDTVCERCIDGKTYSSVYSSKSPCWSCSRCGLGLYTAKYCSRIKDTLCNECINYIGNKNFSMKNDFLVKCRYVIL